MITVESTEEHVRLTIPRAEVSPELLNDLLARLEAESALSQSALTEADADAMAEQSKAAWWDSNKQRLLGSVAK